VPTVRLSWTVLLYEFSAMPQLAIRAVALHGVTSIEDYKAYSGVSNCKN
jgi:hypothetical protein